MRRLRPWVRIALVLGLLALVLYPFRYRIWNLLTTGRWRQPRTVASVLERCGPSVKRRFQPICGSKGVDWPPKRIRLLAFKEERSLEVWAANAEGPFVGIATYPILGASGGAGPKRRQGDRQVPEGSYALPVLNPNARRHLSIRIDYPNADDLRHRSVARDKMGGDIYVHGGSISVGCLAVGNAAIEDIFCLVAWAGTDHSRILIAPVDFRRGRDVSPPPQEPWVAERYRQLSGALREFPLARRGMTIADGARAPHRLDGQQTVASVLQECGPDARGKLEPVCRRQGIAWPPERLYLLAFKQEKSLEVWAANPSGPYSRIATYPVLYHSGGLGPKRREGDLQVPEGLYRLPVLNPNSSYHLSIRADYPNADDLRHRSVARGEMGGDIYLHGGRVSVGCLAMGDAAIEDLFCLAALTRERNRRMLISPVDFRRGRRVRPEPREAWVQDRYRQIAEQLRQFPLNGRPPATSAPR